MSKPDIPADNGERPPFGGLHDTPAKPATGDGPGYSGQEYDQPGQRAWREAERRRDVAPGGAVTGSGIGDGGGEAGEDFDSDPATGDGYPQDGHGD